MTVLDLRNKKRGPERNRVVLNFNFFISEAFLLPRPAHFASMNTFNQRSSPNARSFFKVAHKRIMQK
jgi:hypothetical protein